MKNGYVYLAECCGYYKIGYGKNVEKKLEEMNKFFFRNCNLIVKSKFLKDAERIKEEILDMFERKAIKSGWCSLNNSDVNYVIKVINNLEDWDE